MISLFGVIILNWDLACCYYILANNLSFASEDNLLNVNCVGVIAITWYIIYDFCLLHVIKSLQRIF